MVDWKCSNGRRREKDDGKKGGGAMSSLSKRLRNTEGRKAKKKEKEKRDGEGILYSMLQNIAPP